MSQSKLRLVPTSGLVAAERPAMEVNPLAPGHPYATSRGCTCEGHANDWGRGHRTLTGMFVVEPGCPLHGFSWKADAA